MSISPATAAVAAFDRTAGPEQPVSLAQLAAIAADGNEDVKEASA